MRQAPLIILLVLQPLVISCGGGSNDTPLGVATPTNAVDDTAAPTVSITSPSSGSTFTSAQTVTLTASASDDVGVTRVDFLKDGTVMDSDTTNAYSTTWTISEADNGSHSWTARAYDATDNLKVSSAVTLNVDITAPDTTAPTVSITSPSSGTTYTRAQTVALAASASDNIGITRVEFLDKGVVKATDTTAPYSYGWAVSEVDNGTHSWTARAYDAVGNLKVSSAVSLTVNITVVTPPDPINDTTAPTVSITSPASGTTYSSAQTVTLTASASDNIGVTRVDFLKDGTVMATDTTNAYSTTWPVSEADNGSHSWTARAYDAAGNLKVSSPVSLTVDIATTGGGGDGEHQWSKKLGGTASDLGYATAIDSNGNRIVVGAFQNTANFGGGSVSSAGFVDIYVAKYSPTGAYLWSRTFGGTGDDRPQAVAVDSLGNIMVAGYFQNTVNFGGGSLTSAGDYDIFVTKYSVAGEHIWSKRFGDATDDIAYGLTVDSGNNIIVTGHFRNTVDFGGGALNSRYGAPDTFIAKYTPQGSHLWSKQSGAIGQDAGYGIAVDGSDNIVVTGYFLGTMDLGNGMLSSAGSEDIYLAKYSAAGVPQWSRSFGNLSTDKGRSVAVDRATGNITITGSFFNTVNFGGGSVSSAGWGDVFVAQYSPAGTYQWAKGFGGSVNNDEGYAVAVNSRGDIVVSGHFTGSVNFGGGLLTSAGGTDIFMTKLSETGNHLWSKRFGGSDADIGYGVAVEDAMGNATLTGYFSNTVNFGGGGLDSAGSSDAFLVDLAP